MKKTLEWLRTNKNRILWIILVVIVSIAFICIWQFLWAQKEYKNIALRETENLSTDKEKALALAWWFHKYNISCCSTFFHIPEVVYFTKIGDCIDFSNIFIQMSNSIGIPARMVGTNGERHFWVEIFSENRWVNLDPFTGSQVSYDNPKFYSDIWTDGNLSKRLSYVFWTESTGIQHDVTDKYVKTGRLTVKVTNNLIPTESRIILKSHHLMEAKPDENKEPSTSLIEKTDSGGIFEKNLGPNNYTIKIEIDIIPFIPSFVILNDTKEIEIKENDSKFIESLSQNLTIGDSFYLWILLFSLPFIAVFEFRVLKKTRRK